MKKLLSDFQHLLEQWHPIKNGNLNPCNIAAGSNKKVWWQCPKSLDHEWETNISERTRGKNCPCCTGKKVVKSNCLATTHPNLAVEWHPIKNENLTPYDRMANSNKKVWWQCWKSPDHEWQSTPNDRARGFGCPCCTGKKVVKSNCLATTHPNLVVEWHPIKNENLTPYDITAGSNKKVWWQCSKIPDHEWQAVVHNRSKNNGTICPKCSSSKGEKTIIELLVRCKIDYRYQWFSTEEDFPKGSKFDFFLENLQDKWIIEYHGEQHYWPVSFGSKKEKAKYQMFINAVIRDKIKENWCKKHNINILIIPYWEFKNIEIILNNLFNEKSYQFSDGPSIVKKYDVIKQKIRFVFNNVIQLK